MCSQVIAPIKNEAGEVCMYILNFEDTDALPEVPNSAEPSSTVRFSKCNDTIDFIPPTRTSLVLLRLFPLSYTSNRLLSSAASFVAVSTKCSHHRGLRQFSQKQGKKRKPTFSQTTRFLLANIARRRTKRISS